jgi:hypothetical protein
MFSVMLMPNEKIIGQSHFYRWQLPATVFRPRPDPNENNFRMSSDVKARITNKNKVLLRFWQKVPSPSFCAKLAQGRSQVLPCWG